MAVGLGQWRINPHGCGVRELSLIDIPPRKWGWGEILRGAGVNRKLTDPIHPHGSGVRDGLDPRPRWWGDSPPPKWGGVCQPLAGSPAPPSINPHRSGIHRHRHKLSRFLVPV
jgi:hypothetical protein